MGSMSPLPVPRWHAADVLFALTLVGLGVAPGEGARPPRGPVAVRATEVVAPCVRAAVAAFPGVTDGRVAVEVGPLVPGADVLVGSAVEVTRALEAGTAAVGTDVVLARIPWALYLAPGIPVPRSAAELARSDAEVFVLGGDAAHEARRHLQAIAPGRVRDARSEDVAGALVVAGPLSLARPGERIALDVPPMEAQAAIGAPGPGSAAARDLLSFLTSGRGLSAFAACGEASQ